MQGNLADIFCLTPVGKQLLLFVVSFFIGVLIILLYTAYSAVIDKRYKQKGFKRKFVFSVSDIVFWILTAFAAFVVYYKLDNADIRLYYFIFIFCGILVAYNIKLKIIKNKKNL